MGQLYLSQGRVSVDPLVIHRRHKHGERWMLMRISEPLRRPAGQAHVLAPTPNTTMHRPRSSANGRVYVMIRKEINTDTFC